MHILHTFTKLERNSLMYQTIRKHLGLIAGCGFLLCVIAVVGLCAKPLLAAVTASQLCTAMVGKSYAVTQGYLNWDQGNPTKDDRHAGIDYAVPKGTLVRTIIGGEVTFVGGLSGSVGVYDVKRNATVFYLHMENIKVAKGAKIEFGTPIGTVSNVSPQKMGVHLHMEVRTGRQTSAVGEVSGTPTSSLTYNPLIFF